MIVLRVSFFLFIIKSTLSAVTIDLDTSVLDLYEPRFGKNVRLNCTVSGGTCCPTGTNREWYYDKGSGLVLISSNGALNDPSKYGEDLDTTSNRFNLVIHDFNENDVNIDYKCVFEFDEITKTLQMADGLRYIPGPSNIKEITNDFSQNGIFSYSVNITDVYPDPSCSCFFGNNDITSHLSTTFENNGILRYAVLSLQNVPHTCSGRLVIKCTIGQYSDQVIVNIDPCTTPSGDSSKGWMIPLIVLVIVVSMLIVTVIILCCSNQNCKTYALCWRCKDSCSIRTHVSGNKSSKVRFLECYQNKTLSKLWKMQCSPCLCGCCLVENPVVDCGLLESLSHFRKFNQINEVLESMEYDERLKILDELTESSEKLILIKLLLESFIEDGNLDLIYLHIKDHENDAKLNVIFRLMESLEQDGKPHLIYDLLISLEKDETNFIYKLLKLLAKKKKLNTIYGLLESLEKDGKFNNIDRLLTSFDKDKRIRHITFFLDKLIQDGHLHLICRLFENLESDTKLKLIHGLTEHLGKDMKTKLVFVSLERLKEGEKLNLIYWLMEKDKKHNLIYRLADSLDVDEKPKLIGWLLQEVEPKEKLRLFDKFLEKDEEDKELDQTCTQLYEILRKHKEKLKTIYEFAECLDNGERVGLIKALWMNDKQLAEKLDLHNQTQFERQNKEQTKESLSQNNSEGKGNKVSPSSPKSNLMKNGKKLKPIHNNKTDVNATPPIKTPRPLPLPPIKKDNDAQHVCSCGCV